MLTSAVVASLVSLSGCLRIRGQLTVSCGSRGQPHRTYVGHGGRQLSVPPGLLGCVWAEASLATSY